MDREVDYARSSLERFLLQKLVDPRLNYGREIVADFIAKVTPYDTLVDIGAGEGKDIELARRACPRARAICVEGYAPYAKELKCRGFEVHEIDIERERLPFDDNSVDLAIANQVLEHVKEVFWIFHEISRVLRVGGHLILGVPNLAALHNRVLLALGRQPTVIQTNSAHVRGFTKPDLLKFLDTGFPEGYVCCARRGANFYPFPPVVARPLARLLPGMAWGIFLLLMKKRPYSREFLLYPEDNRLETPFFLGGGHERTAKAC
jgi:SAM-dependent methyltransferase